jgi:hypothetical protein
LAVLVTVKVAALVGPAETSTKPDNATSNGK